MTDKKELNLSSSFNKDVVAYHEAGHLLMAEIIRPGIVLEARLIKYKKENNKWHGVVRLMPFDKSGSSLGYSGIGIEISDALISIAGREAERLIYKGISDAGCDSDYIDFALAIQEFYENSPKIRMMLAEPSRFIPNINRRKLLQRAHNYQSGKDMLFLVFYTSKILADNMPYLKLIAEKLYEKRKLNREDIDQLLMDADYNIDALKSLNRDIEYYCEYPERFESRYRQKYITESSDWIDLARFLLFDGKAA